MAACLVELHAPAKEIVFIQIAQDQIGVRHRGLGSAHAVADRPRFTRRRLAGPTFSSPVSASIQAMLPPPAPIDSTQIFGDKIL